MKCNEPTMYHILLPSLISASTYISPLLPYAYKLIGSVLLQGVNSKAYGASRDMSIARLQAAWQSRNELIVSLNTQAACTSSSNNGHFRSIHSHCALSEWSWRGLCHRWP